MDYARISELLPEEVEGWCFYIDGEGNYSFNNHSPAGEDLWIEHQCTSPEKALAEIKADVTREYENFDPDEHVDMYAGMRGQRGVPLRYDVLIKDAKEIDKMLRKLDIAVSQWELPEDSDRLDCPVCGHPDLPELPENGPDGEMMVRRCPQCFFASTTQGVKTFWGFSPLKRREQRDDIIRQYVKVLDRWYEEREDA